MSDIEKHAVTLESPEGSQADANSGLPPDPDAHLSKEEKDEIVGINLNPFVNDTLPRTPAYFLTGAQANLEA
jgi:hypothetical protein